jgi:membrane protein YqaA with SNARE-associated domain
VAVLAALDSSMLFFVPFGLDAVVIYLAARDADRAWLYPLMATTGSLAGAAVTYWIGRTGGEKGLERFVPAHRLARLRARTERSGALAIALPALVPPPFPLTPFVLACGALSVSAWRFFATFGAVRLLRFSAEAVLARRYGSGILTVLQSDTFRAVVIGFIVVAITGTVASAVLLWRHSRQPAAA